MKTVLFLTAALFATSSYANEQHGSPQAKRKVAGTQSVDFYTTVKDQGESGLCPDKITLDINSSGKITSAQMSTVKNAKNVFISDDGRSIGLITVTSEFVQADLINLVPTESKEKRKINLRETTSTDGSVCNEFVFTER